MHELSWDTLGHSSDAVSVGEPCKIIIDRMDNCPLGGPLASVRRVHPELNPWADPTAYSVGTQYAGRLALKRVYGWLVAHPNGAVGLLHADDIPHNLDAAIGDILSVEITECDTNGQQFRLALTGSP